MQQVVTKNYFLEGPEYQYKNITTKLIVEELLVPSVGSIYDYQNFCFGGKPEIVQVDIDRETVHKINFYPMEWEQLPFTSLYPRFQGALPKPNKLNMMIEVARKLAAGFPFVRIDLYECNDKIYFGEFTFHHGGALSQFCRQSLIFCLERNCDFQQFHHKFENGRHNLDMLH